MLCNRVLAGPEPSDARNLTHVRALRLSVLSALGIKEKDDVRYCLTRYALTLPFATVVSGIDSREVLHQNLNIVRRFVPMTVQEMDALRNRVAAYATDGRLSTSRQPSHGPVTAGRAEVFKDLPEKSSPINPSALWKNRRMNTEWILGEAINSMDVH